MPDAPSLSTAIDDVEALFRAALRRVQADALLDATDTADWTPDPLPSYERVQLLGMGKAAMAMAGVVEARCPEVVTGGTVVVPEGYPETYPERLPRPQKTTVRTGGHPVPSADSVRAGRRLLEAAEALGPDECGLVLVSGGGTALATLPAGNLDLADLKATYYQLLRAGVPIQEANAVRKHLTRVGGGQLAQAAAPGELGALVVSDVVGDDLATIASGPTVPDPSTYQDAMQVLYRHDLWHEVPAAIREHLAAGARGRHPETPGTWAECFDGVRTQLVGTNATALDAVRAAAEERGYTVAAVTSGVEGEARDVGATHVCEMNAASVDQPTCWIWGGEPTVTVAGNGKGGRNQEVALGAAQAMAGANPSMVLLSGGTDGIDGPTDAAGAWATSHTAATARQRGFEPGAHLHDNNAYPLFDALDQLVRTGPTHTNVMDIHIGLVRPTA